MTKRSRPVTGERTLDHVLVLGCTRAAWSYHVACVMLPQGCGARGGWIFQDVQIADRRGPVTNKGKFGRCLCSEGAKGHARKDCDNPHRSEEKITK